MNHKILLAMTIALSVFFEGCLEAPRLIPSSVTPMQNPHYAPSKNDESKHDVSVTLSGHFPSDGVNVRQKWSGGGTVSYSYHGLGLNWLFVNAAVGGAYGELEYSCFSGCNKSPAVNEIWKALDGESVSYFGFQQQLQIGAEKSFKHFMIGLFLGVQFFEDFGDFEDERKELIEKKFAGGDDKNWGALPLGGFFLGWNISERLGSIVLERSDTYYRDEEDASYLQTLLSLTYKHPSGFYGGISFSDNGKYLLLGKKFTF